jgi:hypothetical protein
MGPGRSNDSEATRPRSNTPETGQPPIDTTVDGEVTRVDAVTYFEGASGHAVLSLGFLVAAVALLRLGVVGAAVIAVLVGYGVALNGLSIYAWDELRAYFGSRFATEEDRETERTLTPHTVSTEMKAELLTGLTMVGGFALVLTVTLRIFEGLGTRATVYLSVGALAVGNLAALGWTYHSST